MAVASLEMSRTFKRKDPESYQRYSVKTLCFKHGFIIVNFYFRIVKKLFCENIGVEFEDNLFTYEETPRRDSAGCLSVIMTQKAANEGQQPSDDITEQRVGSLYQVIEFLGLGVNIAEEGIFRKAGRVKNQSELLEKVERGEDLELEGGHYSTHECASVLKTFLSRLSEPLVTSSCYKAHLAICSLNEEQFERKLFCTQLLLELIPDQYHRLLKDLLFLLHGVAQRSDENKMSATNLAMMFCSHVLCPKTLSAEEIQAKHSIFTKSTTFMIEYPTKLFTLPEKLLSEIQVFLSRR